jgi:hypothetical protein
MPIEQERNVAMKSRLDAAYYDGIVVDARGNTQEKKIRMNLQHEHMHFLRASFNLKYEWNMNRIKK